MAGVTVGRVGNSEAFPKKPLVMRVLNDSVGILTPI